MKSLLQSAKFLALDMASTIFFLTLYTVTKSIPISVAAGVALGVAQILWEIARKRPIETMQWMSLFLVVVGGAAALFTNDARFITIKASVIYVIIGVVMLKPGWMNRYLPPEALAVVPDVAVAFGFVWVGLMFVTAALNIVLALNLDAAKWAETMSLWGTGSMIGLFLVQFSVMRFIGRRRWARLHPDAVPA
jgi:intracellular septation protein